MIKNLIPILVIFLNITLLISLVLSQTPQATQNPASIFTSAVNNATAVAGYIVRGVVITSTVNPTSTCQSRLEQIYNASDINNCVPFIQLASLLSQNINPSDPTSITNDICSLSKCSDDFIASTLSSFKLDCTSDLVANNSAVYAVELLFTFYSPFMTSYCFKNSTGGSCLFRYRYDYATYSGAGILRANTNPLNFTILPDITNVPSSVACTSCAKALANSFLNYLNSNPGDLIILGTNQNNINDVKSQYTAKCNASFLDGRIPDTTSDSISIPSNSKSGGVFNNPLHKGLIIGGISLGGILIIIILIIIVVCCIKKKTEAKENDYIPTPGTDTDAIEAREIESI